MSPNKSDLKTNILIQIVLLLTSCKKLEPIKTSVECYITSADEKYLMVKRDLFSEANASQMSIEIDEKTVFQTLDGYVIL